MCSVLNKDKNRVFNSESRIFAIADCIMVFAELGGVFWLSRYLDITAHLCSPRLFPQILPQSRTNPRNKAHHPSCRPGLQTFLLSVRWNSGPCSDLSYCYYHGGNPGTRIRVEDGRAMGSSGWLSASKAGVQACNNIIESFRDAATPPVRAFCEKGSPPSS